MSAAKRTAKSGSRTSSNSSNKRRRSGGSSFLTVIGVLLLVAGVGCLGWIGYQYFGTNIVSERAFEQEQQSLEQRWEEAAPPKSDGKLAKEKRIPGQAVGLLRIPAFGDDYVIPILSGTDLDTLSSGVGWYENSAAPGGKGNFAVAGHRVTHGEPFSRMLQLKDGDEVNIETREAVYTYQLITSPSELTVQDTDTWVLDADPIKRSNKAKKKYLTLTTCQDLFRSPDRSVAFGELTGVEEK